RTRRLKLGPKTSRSVLRRGTNPLSSSAKRPCNREGSPDQNEACVFGQRERSYGVDNLVIVHRRHQGCRVADEQGPPCPALTAAEGGDRDGAAHESEQDVVNAVPQIENPEQRADCARR